jgi:hypothetical protein
MRASSRAKYAKRVLDRESIERELRLAQLAALLEVTAKLLSSVH